MTESKKRPECDIAAELLQRAFPFWRDGAGHELCSFLTISDWPADAVVMRDGEPGDFMGFLVEGKLAVKKETTFSGKYILVALLESGSMVGEIAIVEESVRSATVVAMEKSRLLVLTREDMDRLLAANPELGIKLLKRIIHVMSTRLQKASARLSWLL